jgi:hypothetical protein
MAVTAETFQLEILELKRDASANMPCMSVTDPTSHLEISVLKFVAL